MSLNVADHYEYPDDLYCIQCDEDVKPAIEERTEQLLKDGKDVILPYSAAVCPKCGSLLCDRDRDYAVVRMARKDRIV